MAYTPSEDDLWGLSDTAREFILFVVSNMNRSYKPVMLLCMLDLADEQGMMSLEALVHRFYSFYLNRHNTRGVLEKAPTQLVDVSGMLDLSRAKSVLVNYPLRRFLTAGYAETRDGVVILLPDGGWDRVSDGDLSQFTSICREAVGEYYSRLRAGTGRFG